MDQQTPKASMESEEQKQEDARKLHEDINAQLTRMENQEEELNEFLYLKYRKTQYALLEYAELRKTIQTDKARLHQRMKVSCYAHCLVYRTLTSPLQTLNALKSKIGSTESKVAANIHTPGLLQPVPLLAANPVIEDCQVGVSDGSIARAVDEELLTATEDWAAYDMVHFANEVEQQGTVVLGPDTRPLSITQPPASTGDVLAYNSVHFRGPKHLARAMLASQGVPSSRKKTVEKARDGKVTSGKITKQKKPLDKTASKEQLVALRHMAARIASVPKDQEIDSAVVGASDEILPALVMQFGNLAFRPR